MLTREQFKDDVSSSDAVLLEIYARWPDHVGAK